MVEQLNVISQEVREVERSFTVANWPDLFTYCSSVEAIIMASQTRRYEIKIRSLDIR